MAIVAHTYVVLISSAAENIGYISPTHWRVSVDQIIKGIALVLALLIWVIWRRSAHREVVWNSIFCMVSGLACIASWFKNGAASFDTVFYGVLCLLSLALLATRTMSRTGDSKNTGNTGT
jgi:hypothetical protein